MWNNFFCISDYSHPGMKLEVCGLLRKYLRVCACVYMYVYIGFLYMYLYIHTHSVFISIDTDTQFSFSCLFFQDHQKYWYMKGHRLQFIIRIKINLSFSESNEKRSIWRICICEKYGQGNSHVLVKKVDCLKQNLGSQR